MSAREDLFALEQFGIKLGLEQINALLDRLDHPERAFPSLLIAGTNGKGSVAAIVERGLRAAGYRTGRYTSPHLVELEERFAIDGQPLSSTAADSAVDRVMRVSRELAMPPSFFEATTALALDAFREARVDVAVLEVGLGGRLDATNAVNPVAIAITLVDFDHERYLGETIEAIATEKAGVIKAGALVVLGENRPAVEDVISKQCQAVGARLVKATAGTSAAIEMVDGRARVQLRTPRAQYQDLRPGLSGRHQVQNAVTAVRLMEEVSATGAFAIPAEAVRTGVEQADWPGRLERCRWHSIDMLIDGAHNPSGARALARHVLETFGRRLPMVVGMMSDKNSAAIIGELLPAAIELVFTAPRTPRAATPDDLASVARELAPGLPIRTAVPPLAAVQMAARSGMPVVVAGSLYLVGEIRAGLS